MNKEIVEQSATRLRRLKAGESSRDVYSPGWQHGMTNAHHAEMTAAAGMIADRTVLVDAWLEEHPLVKQILIRCVYFAKSGKYKYDGEELFDETFFVGCIYPREFGERLRQSRKLPGLESGYWSERFIVEVQNLYTELCNAA